MNSMYLAVGYNCNHRCYFCPCGKKEGKAKAAPTEQMIEAIETGIQNNGIEYITLSGGEPILHPGFHDILEYCVSKSFVLPFFRMEIFYIKKAMCINILIT